MEKLVYLIWDRPSRDGAELREHYLGSVVPALLGLGARNLQIDLDDDGSAFDPMVPVPGDELPVRACVSFWLAAHDDRAPMETLLLDQGVRRAGYLVTESMYRDYGDNPHSGPRHWPAGERSPGITTLTVFDKPPGADDDAFYGHWYGHQSPMSEWMQPRARYVRNAVVRPLTPGAPRYRAIVEESWATLEDLTDLVRFFGARESDLGENIRIMLDSTKLLYDPATMRNFTMSEYLFTEPPPA